MAVIAELSRWTNGANPKSVVIANRTYSLSVKTRQSMERQGVDLKYGHTPPSPFAHCPWDGGGVERAGSPAPVIGLSPPCSIFQCWVPRIHKWELRTFGPLDICPRLWSRVPTPTTLPAPLGTASFPTGIGKTHDGGAHDKFSTHDLADLTDLTDPTSN